MAIKVLTDLRTCLKTSPAVTRAMGEGKHFLLLHRVQSEEFKGHFPIRDLEFFLLPSGKDEPGTIRSEFESLAESGSDRDGDKVTIRYKAQAEDVAMILDGTRLASFAPWHIWTEEHLQGQLDSPSTDPMFLLTCKVVRLDPPLEIVWKDGYDSASPWVTLEEEELPATAFEPVVEHNDFLKVALDAKQALAELQKNPIERPAPPEPEKAAAPPPKPKAPPPPPKPAPTSAGSGGEKDAPAG